MSDKTNPRGGVPDQARLEQPRSPPTHQALVRALVVLNRKQGAWHELRLMALERMRDTLNAPEGIECPVLLEACDQLSRAEAGNFGAAFDDFGKAATTRENNPAGPAELAAIQQLVARICDLSHVLAEAAAKELEASNAAAVIRAQAQQLGLENQNGGPLH